MKISILCIGKSKSSYNNDSIQEYIKRLRPWEISIIEGSHGTLEHEFAWLNERLKPNAFKIILCERGQSHTSQKFSELIAERQLNGCSEFQIIIGGAAGFDQQLYNRVNLTLSLGQLTWPHLMIRTMIIEQLYRAKMIMENHPYHK